MSYLGGISGEDTQMQHWQDLARAYHDFDSYMTQHAGIICNGQTQSSASVPGAIFGLLDFQSRADYDRVLAIQLRGNSLQPLEEVADVESSGQIFENKHVMRRRLAPVRA